MDEAPETLILHPAETSKNCDKWVTIKRFWCFYNGDLGEFVFLFQVYLNNKEIVFQNNTAEKYYKLYYELYWDISGLLKDGPDIYRFPNVTLNASRWGW